MDINSENIRVITNEGEVLVSLKWYLGASRYNNGCTRYGRKYYLRLVMGWAKAHASKVDKIRTNRH